MTVSSMARAQQAAEALMLDRFTGYAPTGRTAQNETTGLEEPVLDPKGTTAGRVQGPSSQASDTNTRTETVAGIERPVIVGGLHLPLAAAPQIGWEYLCTQVGPATPAAMLGKRWRVVNVPLKSYMTAYRCDVVDVS